MPADNYADILLLISSSRLPPTPGTQLNVVEWEEVEVLLHIVESKRLLNQSIICLLHLKEAMEAAHGCKEVEAMVGVGGEIRYDY